MDTDRLWAPWRLGYVQGDTAAEPAVDVRDWRPGAEPTCFLCRAAATAADHDRALGVVERTPLSIVLTNRYPYSNGHLLVAPLDHEAGLTDLGDDALLDLQRLIAAWCRRMSATMQAHGFNIGLNLGAAAGAGVPGHVHWHVVPRWPGDVNFMPTVAGTRVLPQSLDALWDQLRRAAAADAQ
jgi:ATP adenylyltransferase